MIGAALSANASPQSRALARTRVTAGLERAAAILADSEFVRGEVLPTFGVEPERVHTVHPGASTTFVPRSAETISTLQALDLVHGQYLLTVGTIEPRPAAFVFVSLDEGFGLPPVEAMASGVPAGFRLGIGA